MQSPVLLSILEMAIQWILMQTTPVDIAAENEIKSIKAEKLMQVHDQMSCLIYGAQAF